MIELYPQTEEVLTQEEKIQQFLTTIRSNRSYKGNICIYESILVVLNNHKTRLILYVCKDIYMEVATNLRKKYNMVTTISNVERNIRTFRLATWGNEDNRDLMIKIFNIDPRENKSPTNIEFIFGLYDYLTLNRIIDPNEK